MQAGLAYYYGADVSALPIGMRRLAELTLEAQRISNRKASDRDASRRFRHAQNSAIRSAAAMRRMAKASAAAASVASAAATSGSKRAHDAGEQSQAKRKRSEAVVIDVSDEKNDVSPPPGAAAAAAAPAAVDEKHGRPPVAAAAAAAVADRLFDEQDLLNLEVRIQTSTAAPLVPNSALLLMRTSAAAAAAAACEFEGDNDALRVKTFDNESYGFEPLVPVCYRLFKDGVYGDLLTTPACNFPECVNSLKGDTAIVAHITNKALSNVSACSLKLLSCKTPFYSLVHRPGSEEEIPSHLKAAELLLLQDRHGTGGWLLSNRERAEWRLEAWANSVVGAKNQQNTPSELAALVRRGYAVVTYDGFLDLPAPARVPAPVFGRRPPSPEPEIVAASSVEPVSP